MIPILAAIVVLVTTGLFVWALCNFLEVLFRAKAEDQ